MSQTDRISVILLSPLFWSLTKKMFVTRTQLSQRHALRNINKRSLLPQLQTLPPNYINQRNRNPTTSRVPAKPPHFKRGVDGSGVGHISFIDGLRTMAVLYRRHIPRNVMACEGDTSAGLPRNSWLLREGVWVRCTSMLSLCSYC